MNATANTAQITLEDVAAAEKNDDSLMTGRELISMILAEVDNLDAPIYIEIKDYDTGRFPIKSVIVYDSEPEDTDGAVVFPTIVG